MMEDQQRLIDPSESILKDGSHDADCSEVDDPQLDSVMREICSRSALVGAGHLEKKMAVMAASFETVEFSSVYFCSRPIAALASKRPFQLFMLLWALISSFEVYRSYLILTNQKPFQCRYLRFTALELRNGVSEGITSPGISNLGLLDGNWPLKVISNSSAERSTVTLEFENMQMATGVYFETDVEGSDPGLDPIKFQMTTSADGTNWKLVGSSSWAHSRAVGQPTEVLVHYDNSYDTPTARSTPVLMDVRLGLAWTVSVLVSFVLDTCTFLGMVLCGWLRFERYAKVLLVGDYILSTFLVFAVGLSTGIPQLKWHSAVTFGSSVGFGCLIWMYEKYLIYINSVFGIWMMYRGLTLVDWLFGYGVAIFSAHMFFFALHYNVIRKANLLVRPDFEAYELLWANIMDQADQRQHIDKLRDIAQNSTKHDRQSAVPARQFRSVAVASAPERSESFDHVFIRNGSEEPKSTIYPGPPVRSLEQLYTQAQLLDPILVKKVQNWAAVSKGCFPVPTDNAVSRKKFEEWNSIAQSAEMRNGVLFAKIKKPSRAIAKALRSYEGDTSKLLDLARQTIVFETVEDLANCLSAICNDESIFLHRIKNRLDPDYDAKLSAGYRDVALNLRIVNDQTTSLGVHTHVCEVQLLLRSYSERKSESSHKRYVVFRNLRGQ